jgi:predicted dehydrogenase
VSAPVHLAQAGEAWRQISPSFPGEAPGRAAGPDHHLGVEHLVDCILNDWEPVLSMDHALHVVEIIERAALAAATGQHQEMTSTFRYPIPVVPPSARADSQATRITQ